MKAQIRCLFLALALVLTALSPAVAQAQQEESFVEKLDVSEEAVTFHTEGTYVSFVMQVAGPEAFYLQKHFDGDETPSLHMNTDGALLADGSYAIQVSAQPKIPDAMRAVLEEARAQNDGARLRKLMLEAGIGQKTLVYAMNVGVREGKFLNPEGEEPTDEAVNDTKTEGLDAIRRSMPPIQSVQLTGRRWDAAYMPNQPDLTGTGVQPAGLAADPSGAAPPFMQATPDPAAAWYEVTFHNTAEDGTSLTYQGFLSPVMTDTEGKLFQAYLREVNGTVFGAWQQGYFQADAGTFRAASSTPAAQPFDYVTDENPETHPETHDASMPVWHTGGGTIDGSLCIGNDCPANPVFGFDTLRLQENNLRIHIDDTSVAAAFPRNDWRLIFNDSANGGAEYFALVDATANRTPFRVDNNARTNALYVDDQGDIGIGTSTPAVDIDIKTGNTPALRLQQDGTSGFTPQTWDVAGNEAGFFVRDVTNGSTLPFRILLGAASNTLVIDGDDHVGIGAGTNPAAKLHVENTGADNANVMLVRNSSGNGGNNIFRIFEDGNGAGLYSALDQNGVEVVRLNSAGNGRVSIGCTVTTHDLHLGNTPGAACEEAIAPYSFIDAGATAFTASSSRLFKENIEPVQMDVLEKIRGVGVYQYDFIDGEKDKMGLMAEDFHTIFGRGSGKSINGQDVQMALWLAVQQLTERNKVLEAQNDALMQRLARIEGLLNDQ